MIYILCPANTATGGPELLHQLGYKLNLLGCDAVMCYLTMNLSSIWPEKDDAVLYEGYEKYRVPYVAEPVFFEAEDILVMPEFYISLYCNGFQGDARCIIWWMAVDRTKLQEGYGEFIRDNQPLAHWVQSEYAYLYLREELGIETDRISRVSDYLDSEFLKDCGKGFGAPEGASRNTDARQRVDVVLFNPRKGFEITSKLIGASGWQVKWQALNGLTAFGMRYVMNGGKIYIDFGNHPGKDRIPREAVMSGCILITGKRGAAANDIDIPIPDKYKFSDETEPGEILEAIYDCMEHYESLKGDFDGYRDKICREYLLFEEELLKALRHAGIMDKGTDVDSECDEKFACADALPEVRKDLENGDLSGAIIKLADYRISEHPENGDYYDTEVSLRLTLGEIETAELIALMGLRKHPDDYRLLLHMARICEASSADGSRTQECLEYCRRAKQVLESGLDKKV